jgi:hypothetical protein
MQLTTEYRDRSQGVMTGNKSFYLVCTVTLTEEEKAIAQERGLYKYQIEIEQYPDLPKAFVARGCLNGIARVVLLPIGALLFIIETINQNFIPDRYTLGTQIAGVVLLLIGGFLWWNDYTSEKQYGERKADPYMRISLGQIITQPTFVIGADTNLQLREHEATIREQLKSLAEAIRESAPIGESNTYEF